MQTTSFDANLSGNAKGSRISTAKSLLKIHTAYNGKEMFNLRKTSSGHHRTSVTKSIGTSFHTAKPSLGDGKDFELQRGTVSQASPPKSSGTSMQGLLSGTDFVQPKNFYLDKGFRIQRKRMTSIKTSMVTEPETSISKSINHETVSVDPYSANSVQLQNHDFTRQGEYTSIRSNPHFNRFNRTLYAIDKIDSEKLLLSKETFYYPDQVQLLESVVKTKKTEENDDNINLATRVLKENKKEEIDIPAGKICYLKIYTHGKVLPLKVDIEVRFGSFEAFVSRRTEKPGFGNSDFYFTNNQFSIDYGEFNDDVSCLYFGIASLEKSRITILCSYIIKPTLKRQETTIVPKERSLSPARPKTKGVYEFIGQNIGQEQMKMFEESISKIKAERKRKNLIMAGGKNWLIENKEIASEYHKLREIHISTSNKQWELKVQRNKDMKDVVETEKKKKMALEKVKYELVKMEAEMNEKRAKKKREKFRVEASWTVMLVLFRLVKEVTEKKRAMVAVNVLKKMKEMTATQIQKKMRKLLNKTYLVRVFGHRNETFLESSDLEIRNQVNLFKALNSMALFQKSQKEETAGLVVSYLVEDLVIPMKLTTGLEKYIQRVIRVQRQWRTKRIISAAKVMLFMKVWRQFCQEILDEEADLKRKKYSPLIPQIRDFHIMKYARKFVRDKLRTFLRNIHAVAEKEKAARLKAKTTTSIIDIPPKQAEQAADQQTPEGSSAGNTQKSVVDYDDPSFKMRTVFTKPSKEDLRVILDKIADETKDGKGGIKSFLL